MNLFRFSIFISIFILEFVSCIPKPETKMKVNLPTSLTMLTELKKKLLDLLGTLEPEKAKDDLEDDYSEDYDDDDYENYEDADIEDIIGDSAFSERGKKNKGLLKNMAPMPLDLGGKLHSTSTIKPEEPETCGKDK